MMLTFEICGKGRLLAESSGWWAGREIDVDALVCDMESVGFVVPDVARRFLGSFWRIRIQHLPSIVINDDEIFCWTDFDPTWVRSEGDAWVAQRCAEVIGEPLPLCPVGIDGFHLTVYLSSDGEVFAGMDSTVFHYAENVDELFVKMADGTRPQVVGEWAI